VRCPNLRGTVVLGRWVGVFGAARIRRDSSFPPVSDRIIAFVDNLFVFLLIFSYFKSRRKYQHRVLMGRARA